jgi:DNA-binding transcriptional ArsR family regulator
MVVIPPVSESDTDPDKQEDIDDLSKRIGQLEEALRDVTRPYAELSEHITRFQEIVGRYFRLLDLYQKHGSISIDVILPEVKDPMSKEIMRILLDKPGQNISQITEELRSRSGSASRRIVRGRLNDLVEKDLVVEKVGRKQKTYEISESVVNKWSQVLGLSK